MEWTLTGSALKRSTFRLATSASNPTTTSSGRIPSAVDILPPSRAPSAALVIDAGIKQVNPRKRASKHPRLVAIPAFLVLYNAIIMVLQWQSNGRGIETATGQAG